MLALAGVTPSGEVLRSQSLAVLDSGELPHVAVGVAARVADFVRAINAEYLNTPGAQVHLGAALFSWPDRDRIADSSLGGSQS